MGDLEIAQVLSNTVHSLTNSAAALTNSASSLATSSSSVKDTASALTNSLSNLIDQGLAAGSKPIYHSLSLADIVFVGSLLATFVASVIAEEQDQRLKNGTFGAIAGTSMGGLAALI